MHRHSANGPPVVITAIFLLLSGIDRAEAEPSWPTQIRLENGRVHCVVIAVPRHGGGDVRATQRKVLQSLPDGVNALIVSDNPRVCHRGFEREFSSGRFLRLSHVGLASPWVRDFFPGMLLQRDGKRVKRSLFSLMSKYPADGELGPALAKATGFVLEQHFLAGEWGNIMIDPQARTAFTTNYWRSLDRPNVGRVAKKRISHTLCSKLGVERVVWLPSAQGLAATYHVDVAAKIVPVWSGQKETTRRIVFVADSRSRRFKSALDSIAKRFDKEGYDVIRLMNAEASQQKRFAFSYTNATLVNGVAFVPQYSDPKRRRKRAATINQARLDRNAIQAYEELGYKVVGVPARNAARRNGSVHCLTAVITDRPLMQRLVGSLTK